MSDLVSVLRRLAVLAGAVVTVGAGAAAAQASYGEIGHFGGEKGTEPGHLEPSSEAAAFGVNPKDNSVYVVDLPDEKNEYRIQKFEVVGGKYKVVASVKFKPADAEGPEEPDVVEGLAVDPTLKRVYVLAVEVRPEGEKRIDAFQGAASQLFAFSTEQSGEALVPVGSEGGVLAGPKILKPLSNKVGESLLEPTGIAVDPTNDDVIIMGNEGTGEEGSEPLVALERITKTGTLGARYVDSTNYFEGEAVSPAVSPTGKVYVENVDEIDEIPSNFGSSAKPEPLVTFDPAFEKLTIFPGGPYPYYGGSLAIGEEGTIYTKASIVQQLEGKITGFNYPGVLEFNSKGEEEGWTGGQSVATVGANGPCKIGFNAIPSIAAGKEHTVFVYEPILASPKILEFGPGGSGCATATATVPTAKVTGVLVPEAEPIPSVDSVTLSSTLTQANALSVEWDFGDGTTPTVTTQQYQTTEVTHQFAKGGTLEITETIHTDDLETPEIVEHRKIHILPPKPTATTGEASPVANTTATLKGTVNPNGEAVTSCKFEYGTSSSFGSSAACTPSSLGSGKSAVAVSAAISSLAEHTIYHYRLVAIGVGGTSEGSEATLTTGPKPTVVTGEASSIGQTSATLSATVDPEGAAVSNCHFDYGTSTSYGSSVPCATLPAGSGTSPIAVSALPAGLSSGTTYHFRIVATNASGTSYGTDASFMTSSPPKIEEEPVVTTPTTSTSSTTSSPPPPGPAVVTLAGSSASANAAGAFALKVACPADAGSCSGTVVLKTAKAVVASVGHAAKRKAAILVLATGSFSVGGGQVKILTLHLSAKARALLIRMHVLSVRVTIVARNSAGAPYTGTATVTLRAPKAKHH